MFLVLARRSATVYAAAAGGAAALFDILTERVWAGNWQGGVVSATTSLVWMLPGVVLAAGIDSRRYLRDLDLSPASSLRPVRTLTVTIAAAATAPVLATVTLILTTFAVNANISGFTSPGYLTVVLPLVFVLGYTAWGFLCGRYLDIVPLVGVAAVTGFLMPTLLAYHPDVRRALLSPVDNGGASPPLFLRWETVLAQIGIGTLLFLGVLLYLLLDSQRAHRRWWPRMVVALATVAVIATVLGTADPHRHYEATNAAGPRTCRSSSGFTVCVWPDHAPLLAPTLRVTPRLLDTLGDTWAESPDGLVEYGLLPPEGWDDFGTGTTFARDDADLAYGLAAVLVARLVCGPGDHVPYLNSEVNDREQWLLAAAGYLPDAYATEGVQRIRREPLDQQRAWWISGTGTGSPCP